MIDKKRVVEKIVNRFESECKFNIRDETRCFYVALVEEIFNEIIEHGEVFLKEKLTTNEPVEVIDGVVTTAIGESPIVGIEETELKIK